MATLVNADVARSTSFPEPLIDIVKPVDQIVESQLFIKDSPINFAKVGHGPHNILCMAGSLGTWQTDFANVLDTFDREKFTIVAWDAPGYGKSRPPDRHYNVDSNWADAIYAHQLMQNLNLLPYSMIGWSDGGATSMILGATQQASVRSIVAIGVTAYIDAQLAKLYRSITDIKRMSAERTTAYRDVYTREYLQYIWALHMKSRIEIFEHRNGDKVRSVLPEVRCPVLIVNGDKDPIVAPEHPEYLMRNLRDASFLNKIGGDHSLHIKHPDWFRHHATKFLDRM